MENWISYRKILQGRFHCTEFVNLTLCQDKGIVNVYNFENKKSLFLQDENDNLPIFDMSEYTFTVSESVLVGTIIGKVRATDVDITDNIRYRFSNSDKLDIDSITGEITLKAPLDFEDGFLFKILGSKILIFQRFNN